MFSFNIRMVKLQKPKQGIMTKNNLSFCIVHIRLGCMLAYEKAVIIFSINHIYQITIL